MRIAAALRKSFPDLQCWRPGYDLLLYFLRTGKAHAPEQAEKVGQKLVQAIGCQYADSTLLPAISDSNRYVDQEAVEIGELAGTLV
ncbi:hypothetical protein P3339_09125 [Microbulbifer sp. MLAF003]|uniref:hypothetical protein n=1 Tax=Microbulbifer sp. MLAF003 TaxID=3032582 RepID=UPI0024AC93DC|nr:hypothetical protein [Microbulbifer sp. MLAF003]WHI52905.1 hypothetical protein P3339_09125 [Microbulbifer sp. MLAF003]